MKTTAIDRKSAYDAIYNVVRAVPQGRVTTYGAVAAAVGTRSGARVVGYALRFCGHLKPKVPAHRVVNSAGMLSGKHHFDPPERMQQLLAKEGVEVMNDKVVDFKRIVWHPIREITL